MRQRLAGVSAVLVSLSIVGFWSLGEPSPAPESAPAEAARTVAAVNAPIPPVSPRPPAHERAHAEGALEEELVGTTVVRGTGEPLARVEIRLIPQVFLATGQATGDPLQESLSTTSNMAGEFLFTSVPPGKYRLEAHLPGHVPQILPLLRVPFEDSLTLDLIRGGEVEGVVLSGDGQPAPNAEVSAISRTRTTTLTDAQGRFTFTLPPGSHAVSAVRAQEAGALSAPVQVSQEKPLHRLRISLGAGAVLSGQVTRPDGSPVLGARVHVLPEGFRTPSALAGTDAQGAFLIAPLAPGAYRVQALTPEGHRSPFQQIQVAEGGRMSLLFEAEGPASRHEKHRLLGQIIDSRGHAVQGFYLEVTALETGDSRTFDFMGDWFEVDVPLGRHRLYVALSDGERAEQLVQTGPGASTRLEILVHPGVSLSGRVIDPFTRKPLPDGAVLIPQYGVASIHADGRFVFRDLPPGEHTLHLQRGTLQASQRVTLRPGKAHDLGDLPFEPPLPSPR
ncbi:carboxypeptidase regulatory-like domain-containing protein [Stigmatella sp. ncwal1]|uniref:Carboxypeptidase regulatory-like domain-containing protein n=1 Tax=Stigmatella ashevillensis TaxID=2995309 RepID=A0ABT5DCI1_9BACT|nr:carboxypeptidase regulatory-like domain-containing protein [Stigmatella ashevillena]MDC0710508.1 carboxypeptidase regulatory-like domain-containing protein [Stigmatella ashevillena]